MDLRNCSADTAAAKSSKELCKQTGDVCSEVLAHRRSHWPFLCAGVSDGERATPVLVM